jgi:hypothetical protein
LGIPDYLANPASSLSCSSMEIQQTSFKMMILFRYSSYINYLLRYMCINFLGNTHVWWSVHLSALLITWFAWGDGLQRRYASDVAFCIICFPLTVDNSDMN